MNWFDVDKEGLAQLLDRRGRYRVVCEPLSNAFDEEGVTSVDITLEPTKTRGIVWLVVQDDSPTGFRRLSDAWTLWAPSYKKDNPNLRGRFNLGEKLLLSICDTAEIITTTGTVSFGVGGRTEKPKSRTDRGSRFEARVRLTKPQLAKAEALISTVITPDHIACRLNGTLLPSRVPVHSFEATLPTEFEDSEGQWHSSARRTVVRLFDPGPDEEAHIYEMGIPVVEHDSRWHVDVGQKVPLNMDRDNITPGYLRQLREVVLNNSHQLLDTEDANSVWVREAVPKATKEALESVLTKRFGEKRVVADPSDPEANKLAAAAGYTVIAPRSFGREEWANIRSFEMVQPAGQVTPSNAKVLLSQDGKDSIDVEKWTPAMRRVVAYAMHVAQIVIETDISVSIYAMPLTESWAAAYGHSHLSFNLTRLGKRFFEEPDEAAIDALLIHEFAHHFESDHLDHRYHDALCGLGASFKRNANRLRFASFETPTEGVDAVPPVEPIATQGRD